MRLILALIGMMIAVIFAVQNATTVTIDVFFWQLEASLAIVVAVSFALGAIIVGFAVLPEMYKRRSGERRLEAKLASMEAHGTAVVRPVQTPSSSTPPGDSPRYSD